MQTFWWTEKQNTHAQNTLKLVHYKYTLGCKAQMFVDFHWGVYSGATEAQVSLASHSKFMLIKPLEVHVYAPCYKKILF